ncbi:polymorphic toxin-type HINT domain-containing protein [Actinacidiphila glaucinigra]|uniref:polymorphic toxin-type HINT domain-containing protein n=1 Tax=Actinacidiphila glaucinigra TaxID=235986 RepID=UPI0033BCAB79
MAATLAASLLQAVPEAVTASASTGKPAIPTTDKPVPGHDDPHVKARKHHKPKPPKAPKAAWPRSGAATVELEATPHRVTGLPVTASAAQQAPGRANARDAKKAAHFSAPDKATVRVLGRDAARKAGLDGVLLTISGADPTATAAGTAKVTVDYSGFAQAEGAGYGARLHMVQLPACVLTTPDKLACHTATQLPGTNDAERKTVTADAVTVPAATDATAPAASAGSSAKPQAADTAATTVLAVTAGASSPTGDYKASPLSPASTWSTSLNTGAATWSYSMPAASVPGDLTPKLGLSYSSAVLDGRTANSNNQSSWAGDGFDIASNFVERSYKPCGDDGIKTNGVEPGDLCWAYDNATISFDGHSGELIPVKTDEWRIKGDDNTKVVRKRDTARSNGDNDSEYFIATTSDGTQYYFGYNRLPNWASGSAETQSVYTVPVFGNDSGEPCHASAFADSWCQQGWRWNLDYVLDTDGNDITYWYKQETNSYGRNLKAADDTPYVRGGWLDHIEYGQQKADIYSATVKPMAKVTFTTGERCLPQSGVSCEPDTIDTQRQYWYDTPWDLNCKAGTDCTTQFSPAFFTRTRLTKVTSQTLQSDGTYKAIDSWALGHKWGTSDTDYQLLLDSIQHTGSDATTSITLPKTTLTYTPMVNRLDKVGDGRPPFIKQRLGTIDDELGGETDINYSAAVCDADHLPTPQNNTTRCFPQIYQPSNDVAAKAEWFNKYVVDAVLLTDRTGGSPDQVTNYTYLGDAAWAYSDDEGLTKEKLKTWSQWRGYAHTRVETGGVDTMKTQEDHYFLRGMDGDRIDLTDATKTRTVTVPDGQGTTLTDDPAWAGFEYRTETYDGPGGKILAKTVNTPWKKETAKRVRSWGTTTANLTGTATTRGYTSLDDGAGSKWREIRTDTTLDAYGRPSQADDFGDQGTDADDRCIRTTYVDNTTAWILNAPERTETVGAKCSATVDRTTKADGTSAVLSDVRIRYDGQSYGTAPTKGHPSLTETLKDITGTKATYLDNATSYDQYGRTATTTALASTTVFDTTGSPGPVTTAQTNPRITTTAYTPTTGRPITVKVTTPPAVVGSSTTVQTTTTTLDLLRGLPTSNLDTNNLRTNVVYDALGRTLKVWLPDRQTTQTPNQQFTYNITDGKIAYTATATVNNDGTQDTTYTLIDGFGRTREVQAPAEGGGRLISDTFYDDRGQPALTYAPYYANGAPTTTPFKIEDATNLDSQTATEYDGLGRATKTTLLAGNGVGTPISSTTTNYGGDRTTVLPPEGGTPTTTVFDADGHATEVRQYTDKSGTATGPYQATAYGYDPAGNLTRVTSSDATWTWIYDQLGRQVKAVDPDSGTTITTYNDRGEKTTVKDGRQKVVAYLYDNLSRVIETHDGSGTGPLLTKQAWDPSLNKGMPGTATRYVTIGGTTYQYTSTPSLYDALYRPARTTVVVPSVPGQEKLAGSYVLGTTYNPDGTVKTVSYPAAGALAAESVAYTYDAQHRLDTVSSLLSDYLTDQAYSLTGKPTQSTLLSATAGKRLIITNGYEKGTQRLASSRTTQDGNADPVRASAYTYDKAGNVTALTNAARTGTDNQCFIYDGLTRLTHAWTTSNPTCGTVPDGTKLGTVAPYWSSYSYNPDGTRKTETQHDPSGDTSKDTTRSYTYPGSGDHQLDSLTSITGAIGAPITDTYKYDAAGNTTERHLHPTPGQTSDQVLTWSSGGDLGQVTDTIKTTSGSTTVTTTKTTDYVYGPDGSRLTAHTLDTANPSAENTTLYLGGTEINYVKGAAAATATRYYSLPGATAVRNNSNQLTFQIDDHHGTGLSNIDAATGNVTQRYTTPFGTDRGPKPANWAGARGFLGGTTDPTGLTHLGAREYDPTTARFISIDPILAATDPQSLNGYAYSNNNPVTLSDPTGQRPEGACSGPCTNGSKEVWTGGPGNWQYTVVPKPDSKTGKSLVQHIDFAHPRNSFSVKIQTGPRFGKPWRDYLPGVVSGIAGGGDWVVNHLPACLVNGCSGTPAADGVDSIAKWLGADPDSTSYQHGVTVGMEVATMLAMDGVARLASRGLAALCGRNSFPSDTAVLMSDGSKKPIAEIEPGDKVMATDADTGRTEAHTVTHTIYTSNDTDFADVTIDTGKRKQSKLTATQHHPFWSPSAQAWIDAGKLKTGMTLRTDKGEIVTIRQVKRYRWLHAAYNLTVSDLHTYYVLAGTTPVLVHNSSCGVPSTRVLSSRNAAFRSAKRDLGIPNGQQPDEVRTTPMTDRSGRQIMNPDGTPLNTREYVYTREGGDQVIIQDHSAGHYYGEGGVGDQGPHLNVRPFENPRTGKVPGTAQHYEYE